jgi:hypothetical protein
LRATLKKTSAVVDLRAEPLCPAEALHRVAPAAGATSSLVVIIKENIIVLLIRDCGIVDNP